MSSRTPQAEIASRRDAIMGAFQGVAKIQRPPLAYALGLILTFFGMLALPIGYGAFVLLMLWAFKWYLTHGFLLWAAVLGARPITFLLFLGGAAGGVLLVVFLLKPLFLSRLKAPPSLVVTPESQPLLFEFIHRICEQVGARRPSKVVVTCEVNAAAGLSSLLSGKLYLTIGLPLVGGMNVRQLAGVLAHEFGHFRQGMGMRIGAMMRRMNFRLIRMVAEPDPIDAWILGWCQSRSLIGILFAAVAWLMVVAVRWVMRGFIWIVGAISGYMSRQMEYDADACMAAVAGSAQCSGVLKRLRVLDIASDVAFEHMVSFAEKGELPDDVPDLIAEWEREMPEQLRRKASATTHNDTASWTSTHPAASERVEAALALEHPGVVNCDLPASTLFAGYEALCREATLHFYEVDLARPFRGLPVFSLKEERAKEASRKTRREAANQIFGGEINAMRYLTMPEGLLHRWQEAYAVTTQHRALYCSMADEWLTQWNRRDRMQGSLALIDAGFEAGQTDKYFTRTHSEAAAREELADCDREVRRMEESLLVFERHAWMRISATLAWRYSSDPGVTAVWRTEVAALVAAQRCLVRALEALAWYSPLALRSVVLFNHVHLAQMEARCHAMAMKEEEALAPLTANLRKLLNVPDPYSHEGKTLSQTLLPDSPYGDDLPTKTDDYAQLNKTIIPVLHDVTGDLCRLALEVEAHWKKLN